MLIQLEATARCYSRNNKGKSFFTKRFINCFVVNFFFSHIKSRSRA